jgi:hypothetical protein
VVGFKNPPSPEPSREPFDVPIENLRVLSNVEGLTVPRNIEGGRGKGRGGKRNGGKTASLKGVR